MREFYLIISWVKCIIYIFLRFTVTIRTFIIDRLYIYFIYIHSGYDWWLQDTHAHAHTQTVRHEETGTNYSIVWYNLSTGKYWQNTWEIPPWNRQKCTFRCVHRYKTSVILHAEVEKILCCITEADNEILCEKIRRALLINKIIYNSPRLTRIRIKKSNRNVVNVFVNWSPAFFF